MLYPNGSVPRKEASETIGKSPGGAAQHRSLFPDQLSIVFTLYKLKFGMVNRKRRSSGIPTAPIGSPEQARELMRKIGRDRDKLNEAAAKLFRR